MPQLRRQKRRDGRAPEAPTSAPAPCPNPRGAQRQRRASSSPARPDRRAVGGRPRDDDRHDAGRRPPRSRWHQPVKIVVARERGRARGLGRRRRTTLTLELGRGALWLTLGAAPDTFEVRGRGRWRRRRGAQASTARARHALRTERTVAPGRGASETCTASHAAASCPRAGRRDHGDSRGTMVRHLTGRPSAASGLPWHDSTDVRRLLHGRVMRSGGKVWD